MQTQFTEAPPFFFSFLCGEMIPLGSREQRIQEFIEGIGLRLMDQSICMSDNKIMYLERALLLGNIWNPEE